jgi:PleD family two-component response regulator
MPDSSSQRRILIVDGDPLNTSMLQPYFSQQGFEVQVQDSGASGLTQALAQPPSLILLAVSLPDGPGLDVFQQLRRRPRLAHIPVMFMAEHGESRHQNAILSAGADDFIIKPYDVDILSLRVRNAIQRVERDGINHPRSGLPTGRLIQERVRELADEYDWYKIDFTIDYFDAFRDLYGFVTSEEVIAFTTGLVSEVAQGVGKPDDFLGHRGDHEFVIITDRSHGPQMRDALEKRFNDGALSFYNFMEREQGYIEVDDGAGGRVQKPLMSARIKVQEGEPEDESPAVGKSL